MNRALVLRLNLPRRALSQAVSTQTASTSPEVPIEIPKRIPRGPTDILRALASTVKIDYTATHYRYYDDPFLTPYSNVTSRSYLLAKESGRKAAKYFLNKYPESFKYDPADPKIAAFNPPAKVFVEGTDYTEDDLLFFIDNVRVNDAKSVFDSLQGKGVEVSQETLLSLLQLMCFYNSEEPESSEYLDEQWLSQKIELNRKTWTDGSLAELLFEMIEEKDTVAYSALIYGLAKHGHSEKAFALYEEMLSKGLVPSLHVYNSLIGLIYFICEGAPLRWELAMNLLKSMQENEVQPNLITFNKILALCAKLGHVGLAKEYALKTLAEMRKLGIEPSLGTYVGVLRTFCKNRGPVSYILKDIIKLIDDKTLVPREPEDFNFFLTAMKTCNEYLLDKDLAYQVNELVEKNRDLHGDAYRHSLYYFNFFKLLANTEDINEYMRIYNRYVPSIYIPEMGIFVETLQAIDLNDAYHYIPQIWSDLVMSTYADREVFLNAVFALTARFRSSGTPEDDKLQQIFVLIARDARNSWDENLERAKQTFREPKRMNAMNITCMIQTFINGDELEDAWISLKHLSERKQFIVGVPEPAPLREFVQRACDANQINRALFCAEYCSEIGHFDVADWMRHQAEKYNFNQKTIETLDRLISSSPLSNNTDA